MQLRKIVPNDAVLIPATAEAVFKGVMFDVYQWQQKMFDGSYETFEMLRRPDTVQVICVQDSKILVLREEQPHTGKRCSFPGGRVDTKDHSILDAVRRELLEETGMSFKDWKLVHVQQPHIKIEWFIHTYIASGNLGAMVDATLDAGEKISQDWLEFAEVKAMATGNVRFIGESRDVFQKVETVDELLLLPEYKGQTVDV